MSYSTLTAYRPGVMWLDRHLIDYLPPILQEISEFRAINSANEPEIKAAWDALARIMANQFIDTADEIGVAKWEKQLKIYPKGTDTMDARKLRIKALWNRELPYTLTWLKKWLTGICGADGHEENIEDYIIDVWLDYNALPQANELAREILEMLGNVAPQNMLTRLTAALQSSGYLAHGALTEMSRVVDIYPWIVNELESSTTAGAVGISEFNRAVDVFPLNFKLGG